MLDNPDGNMQGAVSETLPKTKILETKPQAIPPPPIKIPTPI